MFPLNPIFATDSYKVSHLLFSAAGTERIYSNLTARTFRLFAERFPDTDHRSVFFGLQAFIMDVLITQWNENFFLRNWFNVEAEIKQVFDPYLGGVNTDHFKALHDLGYLPIEIKALPEG